MTEHEQTNATLPPIHASLRDLDVTCRCRTCAVRRRERVEECSASILAVLRPLWDAQEAEEWETLRQDAHSRSDETRCWKKTG